MWRGAHTGIVDKQRDLGMGYRLSVGSHDHYLPSDKATKGGASCWACRAPGRLWRVPQLSTRAVPPFSEASSRTMQPVQPALDDYD